MIWLLVWLAFLAGFVAGLWWLGDRLEHLRRINGWLLRDNDRLIILVQGLRDARWQTDEDMVERLIREVGGR